MNYLFTYSLSHMNMKQSLYLNIKCAQSTCSDFPLKLLCLINELCENSIHETISVLFTKP